MPSAKLSLLTEKMLSYSDFEAMMGTTTSRGEDIRFFTPDGNVRPLEEIEADVIRLAIGHYRGRMSEVARRLGIGRSTLYRRLTDLGLANGT